MKKISVLAALSVGALMAGCPEPVGTDLTELDRGMDRGAQLAQAPNSTPQDFQQCGNAVDERDKVNFEPAGCHIGFLAFHGGKTFAQNRQSRALCEELTQRVAAWWKDHFEDARGRKASLPSAQKRKVKRLCEDGHRSVRADEGGEF